VKRSKRVCARENRLTVAAHVQSVLRRGGHSAATASAVAMAAMFSAPAWADTPADDPAPLQEVVISGIRYQLESSQERKQKADEIVDSVNAQDIGALPDRSVTEVLQRIPGIAIGRLPDARDADRIQTEGSGVTIRGLGWVRSELNGRSAFSAKNSRVLGFEDIPPELMAGVDVFKNPSAQQIEGGISGTINLRTRLPFDSEGRKFGFSVEESYGDLARRWRPTASILYSDRVETGIGDLGFLASLSNSQLVSKTNTDHVDRYYPRTDLVAGQTVYAPGGIGWRELTLERERTGANAALQWRSPEHTVDATVEYFYAHATFDQDENAVWNIPGASLNGTDLTFSNGFLTGGVMNDGGWQGSSRYNKREANNDDLSLHVNFFPAERWHLETDIQHSKANTKIIDLTMGPVLNGSPGPYDMLLHGADEPGITVPNNAIMTDPSSVFTEWAMDHHEHSNADAWAYRADADYTFDNSDWLDKIRFGVRYEDYKSTTRETGYRWGSVSQTWGTNAAGQTVLGTFSTFQNVVPYIVQNYSNWFHGGSAPSGFLFQAPGLFRNYDAWANSIMALYAAGTTPGCCDWTKWNGDYSAQFPANDGLGINPEEQKTYAAYTQLSFKHAQFDGNVGVRFVHTKTDGSGLLKFEPISFIGAIPPDIAAFSNGAATPQSDSNSYSDVLPSLNLRYKPTDTLYIRFAVDKGISRPDFPKLLPSITITPEAGLMVNGVCTQLPASGGVVGNCLYRYDGYSGNPNLKPMTSWNFDLSTEWYISPTNSLVGAIFDKQISGFMETTLNNVVPYTNNGVTRDVYVLRPENQGSGYVRGFEGAWSGFFDFLPGFAKNLGARLSYTYVTSGGTRNAAVNPYDTNQQANAQLQNYPLEGLSKRTYNAELYYSIPTFEARVAYNWRSQYLLTTAAANLNIPAFAGDYGQLDASVQWTFWKSLTIGVQGVNLADSKYKVLVDNLNGAGVTYHNWVDSDRRYSIFLRGNF